MTKVMGSVMGSVEVVTEVMGSVEATSSDRSDRFCRGYR